MSMEEEKDAPVKLTVFSMDVFEAWIENIKQNGKLDTNDPYFSEFLKIASELESRAVRNHRVMLDEPEESVPGFKVHGPKKCPRPCSECPDGDHHFSDYVEFPIYEPGHEAAVKHHMTCWYVCKHCDAWTPELPECEEMDAFEH